MKLIGKLAIPALGLSVLVDVEREPASTTAALPVCTAR
jgi:hypothetical protein